MGFLDSLKPKPEVSLGAGIYSFEIWDPLGSGPVSGSAVGLPGLVSASVTLRLPPQSLTIERQFRSDFGVDLAGNPVAIEAGFGPGRWTLRGTHGVGALWADTGTGVKSTLAKPSSGLASVGHGDARLTPGNLNRVNLHNLFLAYAAKNAERVAAKEKPYRLVFAVRGGGASEWQNEEWWILPSALPSIDRSSDRPHDWSFSLSFWALARVRSEPVAAVRKAPVSTLLSNLQKALDTLFKWIRFAQMVKSKVEAAIKRVIDLVKQVTFAIRSIKKLVKDSFNSINGLIRSASEAVNALLAELNLSSVARDVKSGIRGTAIEIRIGLGQLRTQILVPDPAARPTKAKSEIPVIPGSDLRMIAATVLGDANLWPEIADSNGLVHPWVAWNAGDGEPSPTSTGLIPGRVAVPGTGLVDPSSVESVALDPVGADVSPAATDLLVGGMENLQDSLARRLACPRGYLPHHPTYGSGLPAMIGSPLDVSLLVAARAEVSRSLLQDPRVIAVSAVSMDTGEQGGFSISALVETVLGTVPVVATV